MFESGVKVVKLGRVRKFKVKQTKFQQYQNKRRLAELEKALAWQQGYKRPSPFAGLACAFGLWAFMVCFSLLLAQVGA